MADSSSLPVTLLPPPFVAPADGEEGVPIDLLEISATFSEPVTFGEFTVKFGVGNEVQGVRSGNGTPTLIFTRTGSLLLYNTIHRVSLLDLADLNGNPIVDKDCDGDGDPHDFCWTFKTEKPVVSFSSVSLEVLEGGGQVVLTVGLSDETHQTVTVNYATMDGSATAPSDFEASSGVLMFSPGQTSQNLPPINITNDEIWELSQSFHVVLSEAVNADLAVSAAEVIILDDDPRPVVSFQPATYETTENMGSVSLIAALSGNSEEPVTVTYTTLDGSATTPSDYAAAQGELVFAPGNTNQSLVIDITDDTLHEETEEFFASLTGSDYAELGVAEARITIVDDDPLPEVSFNPTAYEVGEGDGSVRVTVQLNMTSANVVAVTYETIAESAAAEVDFVPRNGDIIFNPGETQKGRDITIIDDEADEETETFRVVLTGVQGATLGAAAATVSILDNDEPGIPPVCSFTADETTIEPGESVQFFNTSTGAEPLTYLWDFGDGSASTEASPRHTFAELGMYQVVLTVANPFGSDSCGEIIRVIVPGNFTFIQSIISWPPASTYADVADFNVIGMLELTPEFNDAILHELLTIEIEIGGQDDDDTITLIRREDRYLFKENPGPDVSGLEIRRVVIRWFSSGVARFSVSGQFRLDDIDEHTRPASVTYGFEAQVLFDGQLQELEDSTVVPHIHQSEAHQWVYKK